MNKLIEKIKFAIIFLLLVVIGYFQFYKVPSLQREINSFETQPPKVVYKQGETDTVVVHDTTTVYKAVSTSNSEPAIETQQDSSNVYKTAVEDTLIEGNIYSDVGFNGELKDTWIQYSFKKPVYSTKRVDTVETTQTIIKNVEVPADKNVRLQVGLGAGIGAGYYDFGPSITILDKKDRAYGYTYGAINGIHWVTFKQTIRL